jgi:hypothetical protein
MNDGLQEWLNAKDGPDTRWLQLLEEYENSLMNVKRIVQWLDAAYAKGYNDGKGKVQ